MKTPFIHPLLRRSTEVSRSSLVAGLLILAAAPAALAATNTWTGAAPAGPFQRDWSNTANWSAGNVAESGDLAVFPAGASYIGPVVQNLGGQFSNLQGIIFQAPGYTLTQLPVSVSGVIGADYAAAGAAVVDVAVKLDATAAFSANNSSAQLEFRKAVDLNGKTLTVGGTGVLKFDGAVNGLGNIVKNGTGRMEINGAMPQGGGVSVNDGTVLCNHISMGKPVNVHGGRLGGNGTAANVTVDNGGAVEPGLNGGGTLTVTGSVSLNATASARFFIATAGAGGYTRIASAGGFTAGGGALVLTFAAGYQPSVGAVMTLVDNQSANAVSGTFAGLPEGGTRTQGGVIYRISYTGGTGNEVTLTAIGAVDTGVERVWTGAADTFWSTPGNWIGGVAPQPGDSVQFPGVPVKVCVNTLASGFPLQRVRLTAGGYTLSGAALALTDGIVQQAPAGAAVNTVTLPLTGPVVAGRTTTVRLQSGGDLLLAPVTGFAQPFSDDVLLLQNDQPGSLLTSRVALSGAGVLAKSGAGPARVEGVSTHTGGTRVYEGELQAPMADALGSNQAGIDPAGTLVTGSPAGAFVDFSIPVSAAGRIRAAGPTRWTGQVFTQAGQLARFSADAAMDLEIDGVIAGNGGVQFEGLGNHFLKGSAANTYSGPTLVKDHAIVLAMKSAGLVSLPGEVMVSNARLEIHNADQIADAATVEVNAGGAFYCYAPETVNRLRLNYGVVRGFAPLTVTGSIESLAGADTSFISGTLAAGPAPVAWITADGAAQPDIEFNGALSHGAGTTGRFVLSGPGRVKVLDGSAADHAEVELTLNAGTLEWNDLPAGAAPFGPAVVLNGGTLTGTGCVRSITAQAGGALAPGGTPGTFQSGPVSLAPGAVVHVDLNGPAGDLLKVDGSVSLNSAALVLHGTAPAYGAPVVIVSNDGADAVSTPFSALPEGGRIILGTALLQVSYTGGDGNDITLTRVPPPAPDDARINFAGLTTGLAGVPVPVTATGEGLPGFSYSLEYSTDLQTWTTAATRPADSNGQLSLTWIASGSWPRLFLRMRAL